MSITFEIPTELENALAEENGDLSRMAKEAFVAELYRQGRIALSKLADTLGMDKSAAEQWVSTLDTHTSYSINDVKKDVEIARKYAASDQP